MKQRGRKSASELAVTAPEPEPVPDYPGGFKAPSHLSPEASRFWRETVAEFDLRPHHMLLLGAACDQIDLIAAAREAVAGHGGLTIKDPHGRTTAHPAVAIQRNATIALSRILRELDLDTPAELPFDRPPALRSNRR